MSIDIRSNNGMKKIKFLYILNIAKRVNSFSYTSMLSAKELGFEFHIAGNWSYTSNKERHADEEKYGIKIHQIDFIRSPYHPGNRKAYAQLKSLVKIEKYDIIHCNTPIGGLLGRIVGLKYKVPKIIYQAHGFHFYKGAPLINWILFYPIERLLAHFTDTLITINHEDFEIAKKMHLRDCGKVYYVPGVGIDTETYFPNNVIRTAKRKELGLGDNDIMIISSGDLVTRKNFGAIIEAVAEANDKKLHLFICGEGPKRDELVVTSQKLNIVDQVYLLGYRTDMCELLWAADIFVLATLQEGLSRSIMEAMACGLPCIVSDIRGNSDLIVNEVNGLLFAPNDIAGFAKGILKISNDKNMRIKMGISNLEIILDYNIESVSEKLKELYKLEISGVLQR